MYFFLKRAALSIFFIVFVNHVYSQFGETFFYDTISSINKEGYVHSGIRDEEFIYLSGSSFGEKVGLPTITKLDTSGNVLWTGIDKENIERFANYNSSNNSFSVCKLTLKSGQSIFTYAYKYQNSNELHELWRLSDSTGNLIWKTNMNEKIVRITDFSEHELLVITGIHSYFYHIISKSNGDIVFSKKFGGIGLSLINEPNILVDNQKNILLSWDDTCRKFRDKYLTELLWTSQHYIPGSYVMIDKIIQDSGKYIFLGNKNARAVDSLTGNTIWFRSIPVGNVPGVQSGCDCNPKDFKLRDSLLFITWVSPTVGGNFDRGFTLTRINTNNGFLKYNVSHDISGIPEDASLPWLENMDWPYAMTMDANNNIYMTGSYDRGSGPENAGNWGIMKIDHITGQKVFESTITGDSTNRMNWSQGRFISYFNGKVYSAGNIQKQINLSPVWPVMLSFDTASVYMERFRHKLSNTFRYPSSLVDLSTFGNQMVLLKKTGRSSVIDMRSTTNNLLWSKTFSSQGKFMVPQNIITLSDTAIAASFILYSEDSTTRIYPKVADSVVFVKLDASGNTTFRHSMLIVPGDTLIPATLYSEHNKTNFIFFSDGTEQSGVGYYGYTLHGTFPALSRIGARDYTSYSAIPTIRVNNLTQYRGDTTVFFTHNPPGMNPLGYQQLAMQTPTGYGYVGGKQINGFSKVYSTIRIDTVCFFIMGKNTSGNIFGALYNFNLATPLVWSRDFTVPGAMLNADTSGTSIYVVSEKSGVLQLSKINKLTGLVNWNFERQPLTGRVISTTDLRYNKLGENFTVAGYITDTTVSGAFKRSYFYITLDSSGNILNDVIREGYGVSDTRIIFFKSLHDGSNTFGGTLSTDAHGIVGFYNAECLAPVNVPSITISTPVTSVCSGSSVTFTSTIVNGGTSPIYQWKINGVNIGSNSNTLTVNNLNNNDQISLEIISNAACLITNTAISNTITMSLIPTLTPSVAINASSTTICSGNPVTFTSTTMNTGPNPDYHWKINGLNSGNNSPILIVSNLDNNDQVQLIITHNGNCVTTDSAISNVITMIVNPQVSPTVSITGSTTTCIGNPVTFSATSVNAGTNPVYQWQLNGVNVGTNSPTFTSGTLNNNDEIKVILTSDANCVVPASVVSNIIMMTVTTQGTPAVSISANTTSICTGSTVIFTAAPVNQGTDPIYQWQVNGVDVGVNSNTFTTSSLSNNDQVTVILTSNSTCVTTPIAFSNAIIINVTNPVTPNVSITASSNTICVGAPVIFTATPLNPGPNPSYQWQVNGIITGTNSVIFTSTTINNNDEVKVIMTSDLGCVTNQTAISNTISISVTPLLTPNITITGNTIGIGQPRIITSTIQNGGPNSLFQWQDSTNNHSWQNIIGENASSITYIPLVSGNTIRNILTSTSNCGTQVVSSNMLIFSEGFSGSINIYPNPVINEVIIDNLRLVDNWQSLEIESSDGKKMMSINIANLTQKKLNVQKFAKGLYIIVLRRPQGDRAYLKFLKL